jgi:hypothetical protein
MSCGGQLIYREKRWLVLAGKADTKFDGTPWTHWNFAGRWRLRDSLQGKGRGRCLQICAIWSSASKRLCVESSG